MEITKDQVKAYINTIQTVADAVREAGQIPAGHLYAVLMSVMSLDEFEHIIGILTRAGLIQRQNNMIKWVGGN